jgi:hypothetical protein
MPKIFHEWIKQWIKLERLRDFRMGRSESAELLLMYLGRYLDTTDTQKQAWRVYRTAKTTFPAVARSVTYSFKRSSNASAYSALLCWRRISSPNHDAQAGWLLYAVDRLSVKRSQS